MALLLSVLFLLSGCGEEDQADVMLEPLLLDVSVIERGTSAGSFDGETVDVRIVNGVAEDLRGGVRLCQELAQATN